MAFVQQEKGLRLRMRSNLTSRSKNRQKMHFFSLGRDEFPVNSTRENKSLNYLKKQSQIYNP